MCLEASPVRLLQQANPRRDARVKSKGEAGRSQQAYAGCLAPLTIFVARRSAASHRLRQFLGPLSPQLRHRRPQSATTASLKIL
jgi:hypothetical protein